MPRVLNKKFSGVPQGAVYIGRPTKWGNPFVIGRDGSRHEVVAKYRSHLLGNARLMAALPELAGKDLVCWCAPEACHGDVLVELANPKPSAGARLVLAATGHRPGRLGGHAPEIEARLLRLARGYLEAVDLPKAVISGMAIGWDTAWALAATEIGIPLIAAVPFDGQSGRWPAHAQRLHARLLRAAAEVHVVSPGAYAPEKFERRNEWMVDRADRVVALWSGARGGTARCIAYAEAKCKPVDNLWARWLQIAPT
jgi:uncharacterized phage-like protein YoqJ